MRRTRAGWRLFLGAVLLAGAGTAWGGDSADEPLAAIPVPQPINGDVIDPAAAVRLGKVLFWEVQTGGDGQVACATCHFVAGTDKRTRNTLNPGPDGIFASGGVTAAGQVFNGASIVNDDRVGSQGVVGTRFLNINPSPAVAADVCAPDRTAPFFAERRVTGRNAPSAIGAIFNVDNFWDGRANRLFNGKNPFGGTGNAGLMMTVASAGGKGKGRKFGVSNSSIASATMLIDNSSTASQAVGPPNNEVEMSCKGRAFNGPNSLAAKLLARPPLQFQQVSRTDSVLGTLSAFPANGLTRSYRQLIEEAFGPALAADAQNQFSRIWGQAIQAYVATLVPSDTRFDRFLAGDRDALTDSQERGLGVFNGKGQCNKCHSGTEMTDASFTFMRERGPRNEDGGDTGFHNIGVRPTAEDLGRAGLGPNGVSFSVSRARADRGAFKTPGLRNVALTAPYFHNGGKATLAEVVDFYSRGGDFRNPELGKRIRRLGLSASDQAQLVDFLTNALTDCRTVKEKAPFDHPSLIVPNGPSLPAVGAEGNGKVCN
ncbi:MAG: hypothetical protein L0Y64_20630 [Myxococcaceae bacterium]|nr:hypothetical protein [Myxococcaceae bacterium]